MEGFKAIDYDGNELTVEKIDTNSWLVNNATTLDRITYLVNDTYDIEGGDLPTPFSPSGHEAVHSTSRYWFAHSAGSANLAERGWEVHLYASP